jgi:hypothetical protein
MIRDLDDLSSTIGYNLFEVNSTDWNTKYCLRINMVPENSKMARINLR